MVYSNAFRAANDDSFLSKKDKARDAEVKTTDLRIKDKLKNLIAEYSRSGNANKMGRMQRFFFARNNDDALFGALGRTETLLALLPQFQTTQITLDKLQTGVSRLVGSTGSISAVSHQPHSKETRNDEHYSTEIKTISVTNEFAAHVHKYVAQNVNAAPEAAQSVLDYDPLYKLPWADNVAPLKMAFDNDKITHEQASQQLQRAILDNNGIHSVENGAEHFAKASKAYDMMQAFTGSTKVTPDNNVQLKIFNDEAHSMTPIMSQTQPKLPALELSPPKAA